MQLIASGMEEYIIKDGKKLRLGYTTGSCAAAAAKAAAWMLLTGNRRERISLHTPKGIDLDLEIQDIEMYPDHVSCSVEKDSGDDPDVTKGTLICATVSFEETDSNMDDLKIRIDGGEGIGRVTKRGLDQPVGAAAINSVPRQMIRENVEEICRLVDFHGSLSVVISAPEGEKLAQKTFNPRLGIVGGISILGTTGIVEPMSEQSLIDTIRVELRQKREEGNDYVLLTPGNYGAEFIRLNIRMNPETAVLTSNFIGESLDICRELGFRGALLIGHIGKLIKIAGGMLNTHSKYGDCRMEIMAAHAGAAGLDPKRLGEILDCATCDDAIRILREASNADSNLCIAVDADALNAEQKVLNPEQRAGNSEQKNRNLEQEVLDQIQKRIAFIMDQKVLGEMQTGAMLFSREYGLLCETEYAGELLEKIRQEKDGELPQKSCL